MEGHATPEGNHRPGCTLEEVAGSAALPPMLSVVNADEQSEHTRNAAAMSVDKS